MHAESVCWSSVAASRARGCEARLVVMRHTRADCQVASRDASSTPKMRVFGLSSPFCCFSVHPNCSALRAPARPPLRRLSGATADCRTCPRLMGVECNATAPSGGLGPQHRPMPARQQPPANQQTCKRADVQTCQRARDAAAIGQCLASWVVFRD
ncbi:uncharacterized protein UV8b_07752 [Ustilaginoidea virens]|uniref:Uncharacterized protein n=1 Tax=Ustilaginoidea virens TaxID=1159556 RepID=A0A8E5ML37_USTVR|nr:uncharacterized protein UV8b_07752 [Ustilaginoidea virens]QUC23511.1 hypothetical protein UV8b_07752 [Ustilaginoidea virens]